MVFHNERVFYSKSKKKKKHFFSKVYILLSIKVWIKPLSDKGDMYKALR